MRRADVEAMEEDGAEAEEERVIPDSVKAENLVDLCCMISIRCSVDPKVA